MVLKLILLFSLLLPVSAQQAWLAAPVPNALPVNQLRVSGNACGPACLLDSFRAGSKKWQSSLTPFAGEKDTDKILSIIKAHGKKGSRLDPKRARWNSRQGISALDLVDMANEMKTGRWMGTVNQKLFFPSSRDTPADLLQSTHKSLARSLKKGLPPILSIRRVTFRSPSPGTARTWLTVKRHFVVLTGLPAKLPKNATSFRVTYHDPWGGKSCQGTVRISDDSTPDFVTLISDFPDSKIGNDLVRKGEISALTLSSAIGLF